VTQNATSVTLGNSIGSVALSGTITVTPSQTTTYTIVVTGNGGTTQSSVVVTTTIPTIPINKKIYLNPDLDATAVKASPGFFQSVLNGIGNLFKAL
jgi:hypothetical protein